MAPGLVTVREDEGLRETIEIMRTKGVRRVPVVNRAGALAGILSMDDLLELTSRVEQTHFWFRGFRRFVGDALDDAVGDRRSLRVLDCGCKPHGYGLDWNLSFSIPSVSCNI